MADDRIERVSQSDRGPEQKEAAGNEPAIIGDASITSNGAEDLIRNAFVARFTATDSASAGVTGDEIDRGSRAISIAYRAHLSERSMGVVDEPEGLGAILRSAYLRRITAEASAAIRSTASAGTSKRAQQGPGIAKSKKRRSTSSGSKSKARSKRRT